MYLTKSVSSFIGVSLAGPSNGTLSKVRKFLCFLQDQDVIFLVLCPCFVDARGENPLLLGWFETRVCFFVFVFH